MSMLLSGVDLNLLPLLHALLETRSVKQAAQRVGLSPSAASHALGRMRDVLGDPLLVRAGRSMQLTPRAEELRPRLQRVFDDLDAALRFEAVDPARLRRAFAVSTTDYGELVVGDPLGRRLAEMAPGVDVYCDRADDPVGHLRSGRCDVALGPFQSLPDDIERESLFQERFVCLLRRAHPAARGRLTLGRYLSLPHLLVAPRGVPRGVVDRVLAEQGHSRRIARTVASFVAAPHLVSGTDLVVTVAERIAIRFADHLDLVAKTPPLPIPGFSMDMIWHHRHAEDPAHQWFRAQLRDVAGLLGVPRGSRRA